jgi:hypothetical protein
MNLYHSFEVDIILHYRCFNEPMNKILVCHSNPIQIALCIKKGSVSLDSLGGMDKGYQLILQTHKSSALCICLDNKVPLIF